MSREYYVYILASRSRTLYVGVTNDLVRRLHEHRTGNSSFTAQYRICRLVHLEELDDIRVAIAREKTLKAYSRAKKIALITRDNPAWDDLSASCHPERSEGPAPG